MIGHFVAFRDRLRHDAVREAPARQGGTMMPRSTSAQGTAALAAAAVLLLGGCTVGSEDDPPATGAAPAPSSQEQASPEPAATGVADTVEVLLASAGEESVEITDQLPVLGTRAAETSEGAYEVDLNGVAVRDGLMTVVFTLRVQTVNSIVFSPGQLFDDGRTLEEEGAAGPSTFSTDGVYVLDPAEATRHLVAYDSEGRCVCSDSLNSTGSMDPGGSIVLSATMAAPPESTTTVDVVIPTVGPFTGITLER